MLYSNLFFHNNQFERDNTKLDLVDLMTKSCMVRQDSAGIFSTLPLGLMLEKKLVRFIEEKMEEIGFSQVRLSLLQDAKLWEKSNRINTFGDELFQLKNRKKQTFCLAATAEEAITAVYAEFYNRQKANCDVFQIGNKYRDEMRARGGMVRGKEFLMKDGYSFSSSTDELRVTYAKVKSAYLEIFHHFGLDVVVKETDTGQIGGSFSEEFLIASNLSDSEDGMLELGHIFQLGDTYSKYFNLKDEKGNYVEMACYGIGISRLMMVLLEKHRDDNGFWGSNTFNTFEYVITAIDYENEQIQKEANSLYRDLKANGKSVLLDDRNCSAGKKMADAELIGAVRRIVVSRQSIERGSFEVLDRQTMDRHYAQNVTELIK